MHHPALVPKVYGMFDYSADIPAARELARQKVPSKSAVPWKRWSPYPLLFLA
jgi:hypothetical protein